MCTDSAVLNPFTPVAVLSSHGVMTDMRLKRLEELDLMNVKRKLMEPDPEGRGWTQQQADEAEKWYKRYLGVIIKFPNATQHVPNGPIDIFWHQHILDTHAYAKDCQHVLGYFLHHYPYFGLNGDVAERDNAFDETNELYRLMYGEDCRSIPAFSNNASNCNHDGSGTGCGQRCGRRRELVASNCNSGGSGTGCGQGCSRGK